jgi:hypothetical protein
MVNIWFILPERGDGHRPINSVSIPINYLESPMIMAQADHGTYGNNIEQFGSIWEFFTHLSYFYKVVSLLLV